MTCSQVQDVIEALAADEAAAAPAVREHLTTCVRCAASLALARRIESAFGPREAVPAPARFTAGVLARVRRERWRAEQRVDRAFNVSIAGAVILLAAGTAMLFNLSGVVALAGSLSEVLGEGTRAAAARLAPVLTTALAGTAIILTAVGVWWWAEMRN